MNLDDAVVYDCECLPNVFTLTAEPLYNDTVSTWEISQFRDDRAQLMIWFDHLWRNGIPMVGFNNEGYDYQLIHAIFKNPNITYQELYAISQKIIKSDDRFGNTIWPRDRFAPQIDLYKIHHFDNKAKRTSLKQLQINMRSETVRESRLPFDKPVSAHDIESELIPYNKHDVKETKRFCIYSLGAIKFRINLIKDFGVEVLNYNDTKIGEKMLEKRLGDVCYDYSSGKKRRRQTPRSRIALSDIIFPYIRFENPEFQRVHTFMFNQVLTPDDLNDPDSPVKTKGVFKGLHSTVGGLQFHFGTGGVHASVSSQRFIAEGDWIIVDIDVAALYPSIAIVNRLAPAHLGERFVVEYAKLPEERALYPKGSYENAGLKLGSNGAWGKSNSVYSCFYDPQFAMTIPINGQLMICMLAEQLVKVPTLTLIQANTDGITYRIKKQHLEDARRIEKWWQELTRLKLEDAEYSNMWIRDVNNYVAQYVAKPGRNEPPKLKQKGAYWHPDPLDYAESISNASPPCWYKDLGNIVSIRAAVNAMVHGIDPEATIRCHSDPFDFMLRVKVDRSSKLLLGGNEIQRVSRYYVARNGAPMTIERPPSGPMGHFKRKNGVSEEEYLRVMNANNWNWSEAVCTGKASDPKTWGRYDIRRSAEQAGWNVAECNDIRSFDFSNVNYDFYINEAKKLIIA